MFCGNCGNQMQPDSQFCAKCGARGQAPAPAPAPAQPFTSSTTTQFGQFGEQTQSTQFSSGQSHSSTMPQKNSMATAGLILAFFIPILGLIFSCMGLSKAKQLNGLGRGVAIAGIVISILNFLLTLFVLPELLDGLVVE